MPIVPFWFLPALGAPALSAIGNYCDKFLLVHEQRTGGVGSILIFSSIFGALVLPIAYFFGDVFSMPMLEGLVLMGNGFLWVATLAAYLYAIRDDDIVSVMPALQTFPVFGFILGYLILGETLTTYQMIGSAVVVLCAMLLSIEIEEDTRYRFRWRSFSWALISAFLLAISGVVFKLYAVERGFWETQFWEFAGISLAGVLLFLFVAHYRRGFLSVIRGRRLEVVGLNFMMESIMVGSDLLLGYATLLAPIALVYAVNSFQPAFVLVFALIAATLAPHLMSELGFLRRHVALKTITIAVMILGAFVLYLG